MPSEREKKTKGRRAKVILGLLDVFDSRTPTEQEAMRRLWNSNPDAQDIDSIIEEAREIRKSAKPFRVK